MNDEWAETISEEYGVEVSADAPADAPEEQADESSEDQADVQDDKSRQDADSADSDADAGADEDVSDADSDGDDAPEPKAEEPAAKDEPEERYAPKDAIKEALKELELESRRDNEVKSQLKDAVLERLYPEGIDRQLRDSDGDPIRGIDDLMQLENPKTGGLFTEDEAGQWLLSAQQKLNTEVEKMESYAERVVEVDANLRDGANRVEQVYGEILTKHPEVADRIQEQYSKTMVRDPNSGLIIDMPVDIVEFYATALSGYSEAEQLRQQQAEAEARSQAEQKRASQHERADLTRVGTASTLNREDKGWAEAMDEYYNE